MNEMRRCSRRDVLRGSLGAAALLLTEPAVLAERAALLARTAERGKEPDPHGWRVPEPGRLSPLDAALAAARWLAAVERREGRGLVWPMAPDRGDDVVTHLYSGTPGVVLFHLELFAATGERVWLERALAGANALADALPSRSDDMSSAGLYTGVGGMAYTLGVAHRVGGRPEHLRAARHGVDLIKGAARPTGSGVEWSDVTDIISGTAGIALFLLWAHEALGDESAGELGAAAGRRLVELAIPTAAGLQWRMSPSFERLMPNFSHGTAGIAYTLATLYQHTEEAAFLDAARAGARELIAIGRHDNDSFLVYHHDVDGEDLFYLSWCHGPAGTARLFWRLHQITGDTAYFDAMRRGANATVASGIPEQRTPGFWNNVSQCCGNAGVGEFFLDLYRALAQDEDLAFARRNAADLLRRGTEAEGGMKWVQAENRRSPQDVMAQTGFMQGAAGVGTLFLHLDGVERGRKPAFVLPDTPFAT